MIRVNTTRVLLALAAVIAVTTAALAVGTFVPGIPVVGTAGSSVLPPLATQFVLASLLGASVAIGAWRRGARRVGPMLAALSLFDAAAAASVLARHVLVARSSGAHVNVVASIVPRKSDRGATPDSTATYMRADGHDLLIDVYRPPDPAAPAPVVLYTHGGGWIAGDRTAQSASLRWFADRGYVVFSPDYVLATPQRATWRTAGAQLACAMTWILEHAAAYGGDPKRLYAFGESAGGALTLAAAYAAAAGTAASSCAGNVPVVRAVAAQYPALDPVTFYQNADLVQGRFARSMVAQYLGGSPLDHPERARHVAAATYITPHAPPTLLLLADNDHLVPIEGALDFVDRAHRAGVAVRTVRFPWADHTINLPFYSVPNQAMLQIMLRHFCEHGGACP